MPPGSTAPVSVVWLAAPAHAISFPSWKIGITITWSGLWMPPYSASLANQMSPSSIARVLAVVLEDVLDQDRLDDRVQVRAGGGVDQVAVGA